MSVSMNLALGLASSLTLPCQLTGGTSCPTMICPNTAVNYTCNVGSYAGNTQCLLSNLHPLCGGHISNEWSSGLMFQLHTSISHHNSYWKCNHISGCLAEYALCIILGAEWSSLRPLLNMYLCSKCAPTITSLISTYSDQLTVTWTSVPTATSYNVSINDSVNTLVPIPSTGAPQYTFTGLTITQSTVSQWWPSTVLGAVVLQQ
eukprot:Em0005g389a